MNDWTLHDGKGAPANLPDGEEVWVRYRDGKETVHCIARFAHGDSALYDDWSWDGSECDIIAYRKKL